MKTRITIKKILSVALLCSVLLVLNSKCPEDPPPPPIAKLTLSNYDPMVGEAVIVDGSKSSGYETALWYLEVPQGSNDSLPPYPRPMSFTITPDVEGKYSIRLVLRSEENETAQAMAFFDAAANPPVANAGPDQVADVGDRVFLDGSGSFDPLNRDLFYAWGIISNPGGHITSTDSVAELFVEEPGTYWIELWVHLNDGINDDWDTTLVITNPPQIYSFEPDSGSVGTAVTIDGKNFSSRLPAGNIVRFNGTVAAITSASDSQLVAEVPSGAASGPISVAIQRSGEMGVSAGNFTVIAPPVAIAGEDTVLNFPIDSSFPFELDGSASYDPLGRQLEYIWYAMLFPTYASPAFNQNYVDPFADFWAAEPGRYEIELRVFVAASPDEIDRDTLVITSLPPEITYFNPDSGMVGDSIDIQGLNLSLHVDGNEVYFNEVPAQVVGSNPTSNGLLWVVPAGATTGPIRIVVLETGESYITTTDFKVIP